MSQSTASQHDPPAVTDDGVHVQLTHSPLDIRKLIDLVKRDHAGAVVSFVGTTRNSFEGKRVLGLSYSAYPPLALRTMLAVAKAVRAKHALAAVAVVHRLGDVPVGAESILIAVSSAHRQAAWRAGEEALEEIKARAEIWKYEQFEDGGGLWKANRDGGVPGEECQEKPSSILPDMDCVA